jgi:hypothetical protein
MNRNPIYHANTLILRVIDPFGELTRSHRKTIESIITKLACEYYQAGYDDSVRRCIDTLKDIPAPSLAEEETP